MAWKNADAGLLQIEHARGYLMADGAEANIPVAPTPETPR
jgi:hypothetical protein